MRKFMDLIKRVKNDKKGYTGVHYEVVRVGRSKS